MTYPIDEIKAACERFAAEGLSWEQMVEAILHLVAEIAADCRNRRLSLAEIDMSRGNQFKLGLAVLDEYYRGAYCGYRVSPKIYSEERNRILAAIQEAQSIGRARLADQSPQARASEAQLSARHVEGTDQQAGLSNLPRLHAFPIAKNFAKKDCGERLAEYMNVDLHLKPPQREDEFQADTRPGYLDMVETLARDGTNLFEHPNPPARIITALARKATRRRRVQDARYLELTPESLGALGVLENSLDQINTRIDVERGLAGLSSDQIKALKAKAEGLGLRSPETAESLDWTPDRLERTRRLLCPDQKAGKALRTHFAAYNPTDDAK